MAEPNKSEFERAAEEERMSLAAEFWVFLKENKKWWMLPILLILGAVALLVILSSSGAAPFIYTMF